MTLQKNQCAEIEITGMTAEGNGVGRVDNLAVFVPLAAVGDLLSVKIIKVAKNYAVGKIEQILRPSPTRIEADCPVFQTCGGCVYRHIAYEEEKKIKQQRVADALQRIGGFHDLPVEPLIAAQQPDHYRNKAQLPVDVGADGRLHVGFFALHSHRIVPSEDCCLQPPEFSVIARAFLEWAEAHGLTAYDEEQHKGCLRHLCMRKAFATGEIMVCVVANDTKLPGEKELAAKLTAVVPEIRSVILNINREQTNVVLGARCRTLWGAGEITDRLCGLEFRISPLSFYQVNHDQAERLYAVAREYAALRGGETLLDLYCGTGTVGLSMAADAGKLIGVEIVAQAVEDARQNAVRNGIANAEFFCADASHAAEKLAQRGEKPTVVVVDPPRKGCESALLHTIAEQMMPDRIVYISCDPATLARDLKLLDELGYSPKRVTPVDMFSRTPHVETVVLMSKK